MGIKEYDDLRTRSITEDDDDGGIYMCIRPKQKGYLTMEMDRDKKKFKPLDSQVSGHKDDGKNLDMLVCGDKVYKPIIRMNCGFRETRFYEEISAKSDNRCISTLNQFVSRYYGNRYVTFKNKNIECIVLENLTMNCKEPCVMDIKIGKRTWDPLASPTKIRKEQEKYKNTKGALGFCVTGFQYYDVETGKLHKQVKEYCKNLDEDSLKDVLRSFLNGNKILSRTLLIQILATLWRIQQWARKQNKYHFYSSSILLVYDARRLRKCLQENNNFKLPINNRKKVTRSFSLYRPVSVVTLNSEDKIPTGFSGQCTCDGPNLQIPNTTKPYDFVVMNGNDATQKTKSVSTLKRTHSYNNNFDNDLNDLKKEYTNILDDLMHGNNELWINVKMIDFAHTFESDCGDTIDFNYLNGLNNLIEMFEDFIDESL